VLFPVDGLAQETVEEALNSNSVVPASTAIMRSGQVSASIFDQDSRAHFIHGAGEMVNGKGGTLNGR
jgi:hypothetical protein